MSEMREPGLQDCNELRHASSFVMSLIEAGTPVYQQDYAAVRLRDALDGKGIDVVRFDSTNSMRAALELALPWLSAPLDDRDQSASGVAYRAVVNALATTPARNTSQIGEG